MHKSFDMSILKGPVIHREGDPCETSFKPRVECAEGLICLNSWKKEKKGKTQTCEKVLTIHGNNLPYNNPIVCLGLGVII